MTTSSRERPAYAGAKEILPARFPLEYRAFRQLHRDIYVRYAFVRTEREAAAVRCVEAVFQTLSAEWTAALRSETPAARAWQLLRQEATARSECRPGHSWSVHCLLEGQQADAFLLRRRLGLTVAQTATFMGVADYTVRAWLRTAERSLLGVPRCVPLAGVGW
ncbi:sigma-70 region 4 domain-containing protein [Streptomyces sp. WAC01526]|uniref:sigma-70 region 4 domain-containing protein n=1 Tax=Streptomyces sp. WAC01526 TaxID=2588709 RepID=UPI0011DF356A|nr:sigma-70 region 4 domain-containing protein [Streptomyces sp. WAC01526]